MRVWHVVGARGGHPVARNSLKNHCVSLYNVKENHYSCHAAILVASTKLKRRKKIETNSSVPNVSAALPIFHVLQLVAVGIINVQGCSDLDSPLVFAEPERCLPLAGYLPFSSLVQISDLDH